MLHAKYMGLYVTQATLLFAKLKPIISIPLQYDPIPRYSFFVGTPLRKTAGWKAIIPILPTR